MAFIINQFKTWVTTLGLVTLVAGLSFALPSASSAQAPYQWSTPRLIPDYYDYLEPPIMVADQDRTVHAFNLETQEGNVFAIVYRQWTLDRGWSVPIEVILPEFLGIAPSLMDVVLTDDGYFNLIYFAGTRESGSVYLSRALARDAQSSSAWTRPSIIATDAGPLPSGQIVEIHADELLVVFAGNRYGDGVYDSVRSALDGTWSVPKLVNRSESEEYFPGGVEVIVDQDGFVHAVWDFSDDSGLPKSVWYGRLNLDSREWEVVQKLSEVDNDLEYSGQATIAEYQDNIMVVYYDDFPPTRHIRISNDNGDHWQPSFRPFPQRGGYGAARMVKDSTGMLHMIIGNRTQNPEIHGMWYSRYVGNSWLPLTPITSGPATNVYDPTQPQAVIVQGNILLAAWSNDVREEFRTGAWYSHTLLDAPEYQVKPLPTESQGDSLAIEEQPTPVQPVTPEVSPATVNFESDDDGDIFSLADNPGLAVFLGVIPALLLVVVAIVKRLNQS
jgi:hypothetical protein